MHWSVSQVFDPSYRAHWCSFRGPPSLWLVSALSLSSLYICCIQGTCYAHLPEHYYPKLTAIDYDTRVKRRELMMYKFACGTVHERDGRIGQLTSYFSWCATCRKSPERPCATSVSVGLLHEISIDALAILALGTTSASRHTGFVDIHIIIAGTAIEAGILFQDTARRAVRPPLLPLCLLALLGNLPQVGI